MRKVTLVEVAAAAVLSLESEAELQVLPARTGVASKLGDWDGGATTPTGRMGWKS